MQELPFRQIHLDFHTPDCIYDVGSQFDAEHFVQMLQQAKVASINVFAKCHHGNCYYPTKAGKMHPALQFDLLGAMLAVLKREGIRANIYFPVGWEEDASENPQWLQVGSDGVLGGKTPFDKTYNHWRHLCHNKKEYIRYVLTQTQELLDGYDADGFWFDIVWQKQCLCTDCLREIKQIGLDPTNENDVKKHDFIVITRFMKTVYDYIKKEKPNMSVFFNMSVAPDGGYDPDYSIRKKLKFCTHVEIESLPSETWGYNHFPLFANFHNTGMKELVGMNGKFHKNWGDFGSLRNQEALEYECFRMIAAGAKCCIGDQLHPRGNMEQAAYKLIGRVFTQIEERETWCRNSKKKSEVGILMANKPLEENYSSDEGAMRMMMELHIPYDLIDFQTEFNHYTLLILPDRVHVNIEQAKKIQRYLANGGKIIATHQSTINPELKEFGVEELGLSYQGDLPDTPCYIHIDTGFDKAIDEMDYVLYCQGSLVKAKEGVQVLAELCKPYFNRSYDRFCSHRQFPVDRAVGWPAVTQNNNAIYLSHPLFADYMENGLRLYRELIRSCIERLIPRPMVETNLPTTAEISLRSQENRLILHIIHYIAQRKCPSMDIVDARIPLMDIKVNLRSERAPRQVYLAPDMTELDFCYTDDVIQTVIPHINGHGMLIAEYAPKKMRLSFSTLGCPEWDFDTIISNAQVMGYEGIEIRGLLQALRAEHIEMFIDDNQETTKRLLAAHHLNLIGFGTSVSFHNKDTFQAALAEGRAAIDVCRQMSIPFIRVFGDRIPDMNERADIIERAALGTNQLLSYAAEKNVSVLFEIHGEFNTISVIQELLRQIHDKENFGIVWDIAHSDKEYHENWLPFYLAIKPFIRHIHIKDHIRRSDGTYQLCLVGKGEIPIKAIVKRLLADGYDGYFSLEWEKRWVHELEDPEEAFTSYIDYIKESFPDNI